MISKKIKGFTIIELIVVIAIIAILAAIVMVNVVQYIQKSQVAAIKADMNQLSTGAAEWGADTDTSKPATFCSSNQENQVYTVMNAIVQKSGGQFNCFDNAGYSNCGDKWYAMYENSDNSFAWCVDSSGGTSATGGNSSNCACQ